MYSCGPPHMANQKQDGQLEHTYSSYVMIRDVTLKTCQRWWMIGRRGERGSGISMLAARHDDDGWLKREQSNVEWIKALALKFPERYDWHLKKILRAETLTITTEMKLLVWIYQCIRNCCSFVTVEYFSYPKLSS